MAHRRLREALQDVIVTTATPFDASGSVDHRALRSNLEELYRRGIRSFFACGNTGEFHALTETERLAIVETHVETIGDRGSATVIGGIGGSTRSAERLAHEYENAGADGVVAMPPDFTFAHASGLVEHYRQLADASSLGLILYTRGPSVPRRVISELSTKSGVVGVKFAVDDINAFTTTKHACGGDLVWINGLAERYAIAFHIEGADGYTTGLGNFAPAASLALFDALERNEFGRARRIRDQLQPIEEIRQETGSDNPIPAANNVPVVKHGMEIAGLDGGRCRVPLTDLSSADASRLEAAIGNIEEDLRPDR